LSAFVLGDGRVGRRQAPQESRGIQQVSKLSGSIALNIYKPLLNKRMVAGCEEEVGVGGKNVFNSRQAPPLVCEST
jgi:hypothetical protein